MFLRTICKTKCYVKLWENITCTVETELVAAAAIKFDEILVQILLSKNHVLLKSAALIKVRPLIPFVRYINA